MCTPQKQITSALNTMGLVHLSSAILILLQGSVHLVTLNTQWSVNRQMGDIRAIFSKSGHWHHVINGSKSAYKTYLAVMYLNSSTNSGHQSFWSLIPKGLQGLMGDITWVLLNFPHVCIWSPLIDYTCLKARTRNILVQEQSVFTNKIWNIWKKY